MRAFLYRNGIMTELPSVLTHSQARAINNRGEIVGWTSDDLNNFHAVIWKNGIAYDLNDLLDNNSRGDWVVESVADINDSGQIAAEGYSPTIGFRGLRLTPIKVRE